MPAPLRHPHPTGRRRIAARAVVGARPEAVFALLAALERHWLIADRWIDVVSLEPPPPGSRAGVVRVRGPLGVRRTARTRVLGARPPHEMWGEARVGRRTRARVRWTLEACAGGTRVELSAEVLEASVLDAALLALGGRRWLRARFAGALRRLAEVEEPFAAPAALSPLPARA